MQRKKLKINLTCIDKLNLKSKYSRLITRVAGDGLLTTDRRRSLPLTPLHPT